MEDNSGKLYRKTHVVEQIKRNKNEIGKSAALLAASALMTGIGALGAWIFGKEILDLLLNGLKVSYLCYGEWFSVSGGLLGGGIYHIIRSLKKLMPAINNLNSYQDELQEIEEIEEKGRTL